MFHMQPSAKKKTANSQMDRTSHSNWFSSSGRVYLGCVEPLNQVYWMRLWIPWHLWEVSCIYRMFILALSSNWMAFDKQVTFKMTQHHLASVKVSSCSNRTQKVARCVQEKQWSATKSPKLTVRVKSAVIDRMWLLVQSALKRAHTSADAMTATTARQKQPSCVTSSHQKVAFISERLHTI